MRYVLTLIVAMTCLCVKAQDPQFTQFYAAPTYLNPAFAGTTLQSRVGLNYRNQWPAMPKAFVTYNFSYDQFLPDLSSGIALLATHDKAGTGALRSTTLSFIYAYEARLSRTVSLRPALQFSYANRNINFNDLIFGDQLINGTTTTTTQPIAEPVNLVDFSSGILLYSNRAWLGFSAHHLNEPTESLFADVSVLPRKYSLHGGLRVRLKDTATKVRKNSAVFAFNYKSQAQFDQLDFGVYFETPPFTVGLWYRNLPFKQNGFNRINHDAVAILLGAEAMGYKIGYSYDITVSNLSMGATAGAHEISLIFEWANKQNTRAAKRRVIPCAKF